MIKKISILTMLLLFFVSTTGLPLTIHFCNMTEKEMKNECPVQKSGMQTENMHSTCSSEKPSDDNTCMEMQECCKTETIIAGVKDSFISDKTEIQKNLVTELNPVSEITGILIPQTSSKYSYTGSSPPMPGSNHIYLYNSIFLI